MGLIVLAFISPSMSKTVITCKGGFPLSRYFYVRVHAVVYGRVCRSVWQSRNKADKLSNITMRCLSVNVLVDISLLDRFGASKI